MRTAIEKIDQKMAAPSSHEEECQSEIYKTMHTLSEYRKSSRITYSNEGKKFLIFGS